MCLYSFKFLLLYFSVCYSDIDPRLMRQGLSYGISFHRHQLSEQYITFKMRYICICLAFLVFLTPSMHFPSHPFAMIHTHKQGHWELLTEMARSVEIMQKWTGTPTYSLHIFLKVFDTSAWCVAVIFINKGN